jgi:diguanylate cyclase (GGDEF)-like protein
MAALAATIGPVRIWLLIGALASVSCALFVAVISNLPALDAPFVLGWWVVAFGYALAEVLVVHLRFRRDTHSFSLSEIPLVVGLFFLQPGQLVVGLLVGSAVALTLHRRQPPIKLAFNLANLTCTTSLAILIFRAVVGSADPLGLAGWLGAIVAAVVSDVLSLLMISLAVWLATGRPAELGKLLGSGSVASFFNTCLALVAVTVLWIRPDSIWLPLVLAALMVGAYRIYGSVREKHESLEVLYESTRRLHQSPDVEGAVATILRQARDMFRSDRAGLLLLATETASAIEFAIDVEDAVSMTELANLDPRDGIWARVAAEARGLFLSRPIASARLRAHFAEKGIRDIVAAPVFSGGAVVGMLTVANRRGDVGSYGGEDVQLLETFANHASASLDNARLISRLRRYADDSQHQALHDPLTGLPNRLMFRQQIALAIREALPSDRGFAVAIMDLDKFKEVNDTLGHHNGDLLLEAVAERLRSTIRPADMVARLGGDEFGILLPGVGDTEAAGALASRLLLSLAEPFSAQELTLEVGASIGIALYPTHGLDVDTLIQRADVAMYEAKSSYRGHEIYDPGQDSYSPARLALVGELRRAIDESQLTVFFQPKVAVVDGRIVGAEALVRWQHPTRGLLSADEFVPVAEHTSLLRPMTLYVLNAALEQCARWRAAGLDLSIAVNLSVRNLLDVDLPDDVAGLLARFSLPPSALELEVTESALIADPVRTHTVLHRLHAKGVGISIDDYGTGYSSLAYIRRMPINELKIDKSFVMGMATDENDAVIVRSTIDLARNLGLRVVAEGVETEEAWRHLASLGCEVAQGYFFGRPIPADAFFETVIKARGSAKRPARVRGANRAVRPAMRLLGPPTGRAAGG